MRVENNAVRPFYTCPKRSEFGADHGRSRPSGVNMNIKIKILRNIDHSGDIITGPHAGRPGAGDHADGQMTSRKVIFYRLPQTFRVH